MALTMSSLLMAEASLDTQLALAAIWSFVWYVIIHQGMKVIEPYVRAQPWHKHWVALHLRFFRNTLKMDVKTEEDAFELALHMLGAIGEHAMAVAFCFPSVLGFHGPVAIALASHGVFCEVGWEVQDLVVRFYQVTLGGEIGRQKNPKEIFLFSLVHHTMSLSMSIPMNMMYGSNPYYREFVFLLHAAAFCALGSQSYGFALDVNTSSGLMQMKACVTLTLVTILWTRVIRYVFIGYKLATTFYADGNMNVLYAGFTVLCLMGILNSVMTVDAIKKFRKFIGKRVKPIAPHAPSQNCLLSCQKDWGALKSSMFHAAGKTQKVI